MVRGTSCLISSGLVKGYRGQVALGLVLKERAVFCDRKREYWGLEMKGQPRGRLSRGRPPDWGGGRAASGLWYCVPALTQACHSGEGGRDSDP